MKIAYEQFRVVEGTSLDLKKCPTRVDNFYGSKDEGDKLLAEQRQSLSKLQDVLYAANRPSVLIIFQAMDAAGKDGAIKHVMSGVNPQGCNVTSFKHPSATELQHDFMWRSTQFLPERGKFGIFNRSYYEEVLIVRVHPEILKGQGFSAEEIADKDIWKKRYESIRNLEEHLSRNHTVVIKFFLHLSKDEQKKRFMARIDDPAKNWKFSQDDLKERQFWDDYQFAYEKAISATSTKDAPWYVVPADDKPNARLIISEVIIETLKKLDLKYPAASDEVKASLLQCRNSLLGEK